MFLIQASLATPVDLARSHYTGLPWGKVVKAAVLWAWSHCPLRHLWCPQCIQPTLSQLFYLELHLLPLEMKKAHPLGSNCPRLGFLGNPTNLTFHPPGQGCVNCVNEEGSGVCGALTQVCRRRRRGRMLETGSGRRPKLTAPGIYQVSSHLSIHVLCWPNTSYIQISEWNYRHSSCCHLGPLQMWDWGLRDHQSSHHYTSSIIQSIFTSLAIFCASPVHASYLSAWQPLVFLLYPYFCLFQKCHIVGFIKYVICSEWLFSLSNIPLSFLYLFSLFYSSSPVSTE